MSFEELADELRGKILQKPERWQEFLDEIYKQHPELTEKRKRDLYLLAQDLAFGIMEK